MHRNNSKILGKLYQLTSNYKGYKKLKNTFELGLEKMDKLLV